MPLVSKTQYSLIVLFAFYTFFNHLMPNTSTAWAAVLDYADVTIDEIESNDDLPQDLTDQFQGNILSVGIQGQLPDLDADKFQLNISDQDVLIIKCQINDIENAAPSITHLAAGHDNNNAYLISGNNLWRYDASLETNVLLTSAGQLASAVAVDAQYLNITDLAEIPDPDEIKVVLNLADSGNFLLFSEQNGVSAHFIEQAITDLTGYEQANIISISTDSNGYIYAIDRISNQVIRISSDFQDVSIYTTQEILKDKLRAVLLDHEMQYGISTMPKTIVAETENLFIVNSLVLGSDGYAMDNYQVFYLSQLGANYNGDGGITRIKINDSDPCDVVFDKLFDPDASQQQLNPSALALDTTGHFANKMFMGTFGASLGDAMDGKVFQVNEDGSISEFVTAYVDSNGEQAIRNGQPITGFYDVTDMAFSPGGPYGDYLYVLSENIDSNGPDVFGGYSSDLWRIGPDGVAELFAEQFADGVISLAFDATANYGDKLFVATFNDGLVYQVDPNGDSTLFYDFSDFGTGLAVSDIAFAPQDSLLAGALVMTVKGSSTTYLVELEPDGETYHIWTNGIQSGDVSSGDMTFDEQGNLFVAQQTDKNIARLDYQNLFDFTLTGVQVRLDDGDFEEAPYVAMASLNKPRIFRISNSGQLDDIVVAARPAIFEMELDQSDPNVAFPFTFDFNGDMIVIDDGNVVKGDIDFTSGEFFDFEDLLTHNVIEENTGLIDPQINRLAGITNGSLFALGTNGDITDLDEPQIDPNTVALLYLYNVSGDITAPQRLVPSMQGVAISITGPGDFEQNDMLSSDFVYENTLADPTPGQYIVSLHSPVVPANYNLLLSLREFRSSIIANDQTPSQLLTDINGRQYRMDYAGPGRAEFLVDRRHGDGVIIDPIQLTIVGGNVRSQLYLGDDLNFNFRDRNAPLPEFSDSLILDEIVLDGSLKDFYYNGTVDTVSASIETSGTIRHAFLGDVRQITAETYNIDELLVRSLGDPNTSQNPLDLKRIKSLHVDQDIQNVYFSDELSGNNYHQIYVGGAIQSSLIYGGSIHTLEVVNANQEENAIAETMFNINPDSSKINLIRIHKGHVFNSSFSSIKQLAHFEILDGDLIDSYIAGHKMVLIYVSGAVTNSDIYSNINTSSKIYRMICGGDFDGYLTAVKLNELWVGYDINGKRLQENDEFTGANMTGAISSTLGLKKLYVTGMIDGGNVSSPLGNIQNIFAEDGLNNAYIYARKRIDRIVLGYRDGRRHPNTLVNEHAGVSGTINADYLGRLYFTGTLSTDNTQIPTHIGFMQQDIYEDTPDDEQNN